MTDELGTQNTFGDLAHLFPHVKGKLMGITVKNVNDTLLTGLQAFKDLNERTCQRFESRSARDVRLAFSGIEVTKKSDTVLMQPQKQAERMRFLLPSAS